MGPLLFVIHIRDVPKSIMPKFADVLVAISVEEDISAVEVSLQNTMDKLIQWAQKEGMTINAEKTKVMVFGDVINEVKVKINDTVVKNVKSYKYLGVVLDQQLDFSLQVNYAAGKAKRAMAKVGSLIDGIQEVYRWILVYSYTSR